MLFSHITPPLPSRTESKSLFFTSVSLLLSHIYIYKVIVTIFLNSIYMLIYCIGVFLSDLTSFCIIGSSFIHLIRID